VSLMPPFQGFSKLLRRYPGLREYASPWAAIFRPFGAKLRIFARIAPQSADRTSVLHGIFRSFGAVLRRTLALAILTVVICHLSSVALAGEVEDWAKMKVILPRGYVCQRASGAIVIDGKIDDSAWKDAEWSADFVDIEGAAKPAPRFRTRMKMLWDDEYLYIAAELLEPHVCATITKKNAVIFYDNDFEVFIDPDGDNHNYHEFEMNALNTIWELDLVKP